MSCIAYPIFLEEAFTPGFQTAQDPTESDAAVLTFYPVVLGELCVPQGRIIACDPLLFNSESDEPFSASFPTGSFPVELAIAKWQDDERVAFARLKFSEQLPCRWEMAVADGHSSAAIEPGMIMGYGVDSGTGAFLDVASAAAFAALTETEREQLEDNLQATYRHTRSWLLWKHEGASVALFSSGVGDGAYASYIGYDPDGTICRLVTDFMLLAWPSSEQA
jgi:hypothetical protein